MQPKLTDISGIGPATARKLAEHGLLTVEDLADAAVETLVRITGFGPSRASILQRVARSLSSNGPPGVASGTRDAAPEPDLFGLTAPAPDPSGDDAHGGGDPKKKRKRKKGKTRPMDSPSPADPTPSPDPASEPARDPASKPAPAPIPVDSPEAFINRELSWLSFARRVLHQVEKPDLPLLERIKFVGIMGMLHDEFAMKRMSGLKRLIEKKSKRCSLDGRTPAEEFDACQKEMRDQVDLLAKRIRRQIRPAMTEAGIPILDYDKLRKKQQKKLREYFRDSVQPILTPLAVDPEHPFPFISNLGLNLAVMLPDEDGERFVRIKVPGNRPRWISLDDERGFVPLEQVIAANLDAVFPTTPPRVVHLFRVTRGAEGEPEPRADLSMEEALEEPGSLVRQVSGELKARRFAGVVRVEVDARMPAKLQKWLAKQLGIKSEDIYPTEGFLGIADLLKFEVQGRPDLRFPVHEPVTHPRLRHLSRHPGDFFEEIARGDILLHHPYHSFQSSVLRFIESASIDPDVLAIKLTIYRTSSDSPIVSALAEAARRGKQVAVLVEITARFDEAPNIAWGQYLEKEGVHVSYGVERLKTHVKLALVVREERSGVRRYLHVGTGNYHSGTARVYEDVGVLTCHRDLCDDAAAVFNALTGSMAYDSYRRMLVAPVNMRTRFVELIRREIEHANHGRPCGIHGKMNQLQDSEIIRELYRASQAGVPIALNVRGMCTLRPGVAGLSENIRLFGVVGRFLEHSRVYKFTNGGETEFYLGSADWMRRNLNNRMETVIPVLDAGVRQQLDEILGIYEQDNCSAWDCGPDGTYECRRPQEGEDPCAAQDTFLARARL